MSDVKTELADSEDQLMQAENVPRESATELRERVLAHVKGAKEKVIHVQIVVVESGKKAAHVTDDFVHGHPWSSIGLAAGVGVLVGLLINRD